MDLVLDAGDMAELNRMLLDFRHREAGELIAFFNRRIAAQARREQPPAPGADGSAKRGEASTR